MLTRCNNYCTRWAAWATFLDYLTASLDHCEDKTNSYNGIIKVHNNCSELWSNRVEITFHLLLIQFSIQLLSVNQKWPRTWSIIYDTRVHCAVSCFSRSLFRMSSSDTDCILTYSLGLSVPNLRRFCRLRSTICVIDICFRYWMSCRVCGSDDT